MNALTLLLEQPWTQALAWTLIHFLWQGTAIGLAAYVLLRTCRLTASGRYAVGIAALAAMLVAPAATFVALSASAEPAPAALAGRVALPADTQTQETAFRASAGAAVVPEAPGAAMSALVPLVLAVWAAGVLGLSVRLFGGWIVARRLAIRAVRPVSPDVNALARRVAGRLALDRIVRLFESTAVAVPVTVGWMKPVVLLPASAMSGLTTTQIEALLAHELAHVCRHDYLVNLLQSAVETLLFYHPAVWWVSKLIRAEREHCCDDVAVGVCDRLVYVGALSDLAALAATPRMALAASDGSLVGRVRRLLGHQQDDGDAGSSWVPVVLVLLLAAAMVPAVVAQSTGSARSDRQVGGVVVAEAPVVVKAAPAAVVAGAARGVAEGVSAGVVRAVQTGVRAGVPLAGAMRSVGVTAAISPVGTAGVVVGIAQSADQQRREEQRRALEAEMAALQARLRAQEADLEQDRARLEMQQLQASVAARSAELEAQLKLARQQFEEVRRQYDAGAVGQTALVEAETAVVQYQQQLEHAMQERQFQDAQLALRLREVDQRRDYQDQMSAYEKALQALELSRGSAAADVRVAAIEAEVAAQLAAMRDKLQQMADAGLIEGHPDVAALREELRDLEVDVRRQRLEGQRVEQADVARAQAERLKVQGRVTVDAERLAELAEMDMARAAALAERAARDVRPEVVRLRELTAETVVVTDASTEVRENDILVIEISGESELPRNYQVGTDGNIRLPLLGHVQVRGMTASQVRQLVAERLADRQLAEGASITVQLRRSRSGGGR